MTLDNHLKPLWMQYIIKDMPEELQIEALEYVLKVYDTIPRIEFELIPLIVDERYIVEQDKYLRRKLDERFGVYKDKNLEVEPR